MEQNNSNFSIPAPPFPFLSYVQRKAEEFCKYQFRDSWSSPPYSIKEVENILPDFFLNEHKIQFLGHLINHTIESYVEHEKSCKSPETCVAESGAQEVLYFLYGQLKNLGLKVDFNSFTNDEIVFKNLLLKEIDANLEQIVVNDDRVLGNILIMDAIENLRQDLRELSHLYPLGKKKWHQTFTGIVGEYAANKSLDFVLTAISPQFIQLYRVVKIFVLGIIS